MTSPADGMGRRTARSRIEISPSNIAANVAHLAAQCRPALFCAVVKANGYGHDAVLAANAAVDGGADWLAVARIEEAEALRSAGIDVPVLILSEPPVESWDRVVAGAFDTVVYSVSAIAAASSAMAARSDAAVDAAATLGLHLKVDTGMHRVGCPPSQAVDLAQAAEAAAGVRLAGLCTHFADADDPSSDFSRRQLERFVQVDRQVSEAIAHNYIRHAANSAATLRLDDSRLDMVRCGIACYGIAPAPPLDGLMAGLSSALRVVSEVSFVKRLAADEPVSYGCRFRTSCETTIVTVPLGYGDGVPRSLAATGGEVLIGGRRFPVVGTVTMDQLMVNVGDEALAVGDEVVLLGRQGDHEITANEIGARGDTIGYEIVTRLTSRLERVAV